MPRKTITVLTDDLDGSDLPETTKPILLTVGKKSYNLYLSDDNAGKLYDALNPFTDGAEVVTAASQDGGPSGDTPAADAAPSLPYGTGKKFKDAKDAQTADFKKWAKVKKVTIPAKGAAEQKHYDEFFKDNPSLDRLIGRGALTVKEWWEKENADESAEAETQD